MSKINDELRNAQKSKKADDADSKVLKDVLSLLDDIQKPPEEVLRKRRDEGLPSLEDVGNIRAFNQSYRFESGTQLKDLLNTLESAEKRIEEIRRAAGEYEVRVDADPKTAEALHETLESISRSFESRLEEKRLEKLRAEEALENQRLLIESLLEKGARCASKGEYGEACDAWQELAAHMESPSFILGQVEKIRRVQHEVRALQQELDRLQSLAESRPAFPENVKEALNHFSEELSSQVEVLAARTEQVQRTLAERTSRMHMLLQQGRALLSQDRSEEALEIFSELGAQSQNPALVGEWSLKIKRTQSEVADLNRALQALQSSLSGKLPLPEETENALGAFSEKMTAQLEDLKFKFLEAQNASATRRELLNNFLGNAKDFYEKDRIPEAIAQWENAAEYLDPHSGFREKVSFIKNAYQNLQDLRNELANELNRGAQRLSSLDSPDFKFADAAHRSITSDVKEIKKALDATFGSQKQGARFRIGSPVFLSMLFLGVVLFAFWFYSSNLQDDSQSPIGQLVESYQVQNRTLKAANADLARQYRALKDRYQQSTAGFDAALKQNEQKSKILTAKLRSLREDNLRKDRTITQLSSK